MQCHQNRNVAIVSPKTVAEGAYTDYLFYVTGTGVGRHKIAYDDSLKSVGEIARYYTVSPSIISRTIFQGHKSLQVSLSPQTRYQSPTV